MKKYMLPKFKKKKITNLDLKFGKGLKGRKDLVLKF